MKKRPPDVDIILNYKNEIIYFCYEVNGFRYMASIEKSVVTMLNYDFGPAEDVLTAIKAIAGVASRYGYTKMSTFVDRADLESQMIVDYIEENCGTALWTDHRYIQYEWYITIRPKLC